MFKNRFRFFREKMHNFQQNWQEYKQEKTHNAGQWWQEHKPGIFKLYIGKDSFRVKAKQINEHRNNEEYEEALKICEELLEKYPHHVNLRRQTLILQERLGKEINLPGSNFKK